MNSFATRTLPTDPTVTAPDGSDVRVLLALRGGGIVRCDGIVAQLLSIGDIVRRTAPGVEQPGPLARGGRKQPARGGKALRALRDRVAGRGDQRGAVAHRRISARSAAPTGTGGRPDRIRIRSARLGVPA